MSTDAANRLAPTGDAEIDAARAVVRRRGIRPGELARQRKLLYAWIWYLVRSGREVAAIDPAMARMADTRGSTREAAAIAEGYRVLEEIFRDPPLAEIAGANEARVASGGAWKRYHGDSLQTGATCDAGPQRGKVAWKYHTGHAWYSRPVVLGREVFAASPGLRKQLFCFDLATGAMRWATEQPGCELYRTPSIRSSPVVLGGRVFVREAGSGGNEGEAKHVVAIDRATGRVRRKVEVGHVDYRAGWAPVIGGKSSLLVPIGHHDIRTRPVHSEPMHALRCLEARNLTPRWEREVGQFFAEPVVEGGRVLVATESGELQCLREAGKGEIEWSVALGAPLRSSPAVDADSVFIGTNDGSFVCVGLRDGVVRWRVKVARPEPRAFRLFSGAAVAHGRMYVGDARGRLSVVDASTGAVVARVKLPDWVRSRPVVTPSGTIVVATLAGTVHGLAWDGRTLCERWKVRVTRAEILADLAARGERVLVNAADLTLHCLDATTGATQWKQNLLLGAKSGDEWICADQIGGGATCQSPATVAAGRVHFGTPGHFVYALSTHTGKRVWRYEAPGGAVSAAPVYEGGRLFFGQQGGTDQFLCVDARTGVPRWTQRLGWVWASVNVVGSRIFVAGVDGRASCLARNDGRVIWQRATQGGLYPAPVVADGCVYFGSWDQHYYCLRTSDGSLVWKTNTGGEPDSGAPCWASGRIFFPCIGGFFCRDARSGRLRWEIRPSDFAFNASPSTARGAIFASGHPWRQHFDVETWIATEVRCLSARDGRQLWSHSGGGLTHASVGGGTVFFGSTGNCFFQAVDARGNGRGGTTLRWRVRLGDRVEEPCPAVAGGRAYVLAANGLFFAIK